jgi:hypothetical protein
LTRGMAIVARRVGVVTLANGRSASSNSPQLA